MLPPTFFSILILSMSNVFFPFSISTTDLTAFTHKIASFSFDASAPLPVIAVIATFVRSSSSSGATKIAISFRISRAFTAASLNPDAMTVGCTSCSKRFSAFRSSSPVNITAVVVPSPTSSSWVRATSTIIFAAGCSISISLRIVTPSFVMTTSPSVSTNILSMPFGPRVVLTAEATALAAVIFMPWASFPRVL